MKHARIQFDGQAHDVTVEGDHLRLADGRLVHQDQVTWLPPATGSMFALGLNYADHAKELAFAPPTEPLAFIKSPGTYTGHGQVTWRPDNVEYMHYECELVAVIGKAAKNVKREDALAYVAGYTVCNDYAIRDYLEKLLPPQPAGEKPRRHHPGRPVDRRCGRCARRQQPEAAHLDQR